MPWQAEVPLHHWTTHPDGDLPPIALLRAGRDRPKRRRAAEQRDELAPADHSITSSVSASSLSGIWSPSALAAFRLITKWYFVGNCTGKSPGFSPRRMRSM